MITTILMAVGTQVKASTDFTPLYRPPGIYDCTASGCTSKTVSRSNFTYNGQTYNTYTTDDNLVIATNGVAISMPANDIIKAGYLYSLGIYVCNYESLTDLTTYRIYPGSPGNEKETYYSSSTYTRLTNMPTSGLGSYCYKATTILASKENVTQYNLRLKKSSGTSINFTPYIYGYQIEELGIYTSEIQSAVNNAIQSNNLATTQSIEQLREELTQAQQEATEAQIESQKVCKTFEVSKNNVEIDNKALTSSGEYQDNVSYIITRYFEIVESTTIKVLQNHTTTYSLCFYNENKEKISCLLTRDMVNGSYLTIPSNAKYFRASINKNLNRPTFEVYTCESGNQALQDTLEQDHDYNNNASETIQGQDKLNEMEQTESQIFDSLDFSGVEDLDITIDTNSASFIWEIVNRLRQISSKIVLLMTSILGLGIIKMILNR